MCSRLTGCAGYVFNSGDYGMSWFFLWCLLLDLCTDILLMVCNRCFCPTALFYVTLKTRLKLGKLLYNYDWYSLTWFAWIHVLLLIWCPYMPSNCICPLPHSTCNAKHAWTSALTFHSIMILHQREREPITSVHWACKHDACSIIYDLHNSSQDTGFGRYKAHKNFL
mgnify:CR=1 FL=1